MTQESQPPQNNNLPVHIRWMIRRDMQEVLDIEDQGFEFPWRKEDFIRCLRQRNCIGMVAEADNKVVGFMIYELHKDRLQILNFAVDPDYRRRGVGKQMVEKLIDKLSPARRTSVSLEVRETNLPAQQFFRKHGFKAGSVLHGLYENSSEDAYLMHHHYWDHHPLKDKLAFMQQVLEEKTEVDWQVVKIDNEGKYMPVSLDDVAEGQTYALRTEKKICKPQDAMHHFDRILHPDDPIMLEDSAIPHTAKINQPAHLVLACDELDNGGIDKIRNGRKDKLNPADTRQVATEHKRSI